jgi:hypothetical protein
MGVKPGLGQNGSAGSKKILRENFSTSTYSFSKRVLHSKKTGASEILGASTYSFGPLLSASPILEKAGFRKEERKKERFGFAQNFCQVKKLFYMPPPLKKLFFYLFAHFLFDIANIQHQPPGSKIKKNKKIDSAQAI